MKWSTRLAVLATALAAGSALAQDENPDLRIRANFRIPDNDLWGANDSVGHAEFRVKSRYMQVYYGGVRRLDEFKFVVAFDFTDISDFDTEFAPSPYNADYDVYINDDFVGRVDMNAQDFGMAELVYDSRHASPPDLPLPPGFPDPVNPFDTVRVFTAATTLPNIGDPLPAGEPLFQGDLAEMFERGDVNQDTNVDNEDFVFLAAHYDPYHLLGAHIGPANGDFTGDNRADLADYTLFVQNWTEDTDPPAEPDPIVTPPCAPDFNRDGFLTGDDFDGYVSAFELGSPAADFIPDGFITGDDFDAFVTAFVAGC